MWHWRCRHWLRNVRGNGCLKRPSSVFLDSELRRQAAAYNRLPVTEMHQELSPTDTLRRCRRYSDLGAETRAPLAFSTWRLLSVPPCCTVQNGATSTASWWIAQIASDGVHKFLRIGVRATAYSDPCLMVNVAALLGPEDVVGHFAFRSKRTPRGRLLKSGSGQ